MLSRPALQNNGGQALDLLTIALKTDSNKPMRWGILQKPKNIGTEVFLHSSCYAKNNPIEDAEKTAID